jgi:hypothetical protein
LLSLEEDLDAICLSELIAISEELGEVLTQ